MPYKALNANANRNANIAIQTTKCNAEACCGSYCLRNPTTNTLKQAPVSERGLLI